MKSKNVNDIINQINNNISNNNNSNINISVPNEVIITKKVVKETTKADDEKKNARLNKALLRAKKKQKNKNDDSEGTMNKSEKVANLVKQLEENMNKRGDNIDEENNAIEQVEVKDNFEELIENLPMNQSIKKKKPGKKIIYEEE